ncbi:MAG: serine hydrolase [Alphaproteobacteria bacterium]|nr:serine hydrolase [Alphaproteobacteria bacterium]
MNAAYVPPAGAWARIEPAAAGFDPSRLQSAVAFARANETDWPRELITADGQLWYAASMGERPPTSLPLGPVEPRDAPSGVILRGGRIVAQWGDVERPQITFSVAKSYLAILAGIAVGRGLIRDLDAPVRDLVRDGGFDSEQNRAITWRHLLQQTSEWSGTLFDRADSVDHNRSVGLAGGESPKGDLRAMKPPGAHWEYNDVRVNRLSLSLLRVLGAALPEVLRESVMTPIGASTAWRWEPYRNSGVEIGGRTVFSVPGGSHWGGGLVIPTLDHARIGLLAARDGVWGERRILPAGWVKAMTTPCPLNPGYGFMWWLNTGHVQFKSAPASSYFALGAGTHVIWIDPDHDLVMVARWIRKTGIESLIESVLAARA